MEWTTTAEVAVIGGAVGLGAYCFSCAVHVWRRRNAPNRGTRVPGRLPGAIRRGAGAVMLPENLSQAEVAGAVAGTLLKRPGRPANVAQAVFFLLDCDYTTGVCLPVDGGRTIAEGA